MTEDQSKSLQEVGAPSADPGVLMKRRLWVWFAVGFTIVFVAMALSVTMYTMLPSSDGVIASRLWQYYIVEFRRYLGPYASLGPARSGSSTLLQTLFFHVLFSSLGGGVLVGLRLLMRRPKQ
jgi:hypothetical protein